MLNFVHVMQQYFYMILEHLGRHIREQLTKVKVQLQVPSCHGAGLLAKSIQNHLVQQLFVPYQTHHPKSTRCSID